MLRSLLSALVMAMLLAPAAQAQTAPAPNAPALVNPGIAVPPFDSLVVPPGNLPRTQTRAVPVTPPPAFRDGKHELSLRARYSEAGTPIRSGIQWRVFHDEPDRNGNLLLAADSVDAEPKFQLSPGGYVVHASYGLVSVSRHVVINGPVREQIVLAAGGLRFRGLVGEGEIPADKITFKVSRNDNGVERQVASNVRPGTLLRLPEGTYHVVSSYGDANSVIEVDVRVEAGRLVDAAVHHKAASVKLRLVRPEGGDALADTSWSILTPGGDVVRESIGALPTMVLAEGNYTAMARREGRSYTREFSVKAGEDAQIDVLMR